jgi:hypothetical protein
MSDRVEFKKSEDSSGFWGRASFELGIYDKLGSASQVALVRGKLAALFGEPSSLADEYKGTFAYIIAATIDGELLQLSIGDSKLSLQCDWNRSDGQSGHADAVLNALRKTLRKTPPLDCQACFYAYGKQPYGCKHGGQYVLDTPRVVQLEIEARKVAAAWTPTEEEIPAYYESSAPPGAPALEQVFEHVAQALIQSRTAAAEPDALESAGDGFRCHLLTAIGFRTLDRLCLQENVEGISSWFVEHADKWHDADAVLASLRQLRSVLERFQAGTVRLPRAERQPYPLSAYRNMWGALGAELGALEEVVAQAAKQDRRLHLREVPLDEYVEREHGIAD